MSIIEQVSQMMTKGARPDAGPKAPLVRVYNQQQMEQLQMQQRLQQQRQQQQQQQEQGMGQQGRAQQGQGQQGQHEPHYNYNQQHHPQQQQPLQQLQQQQHIQQQQQQQQQQVWGGTRGLPHGAAGKGSGAGTPFMQQEVQQRGLNSIKGEWRGCSCNAAGCEIVCASLWPSHRQSVLVPNMMHVFNCTYCQHALYCTPQQSTVRLHEHWARLIGSKHQQRQDTITICNLHANILLNAPTFICPPDSVCAEDEPDTHTIRLLQGRTRIQQPGAVNAQHSQQYNQYGGTRYTLQHSASTVSLPSHRAPSSTVIETGSSARPPVHGQGNAYQGPLNPGTLQPVASSPARLLASNSSPLLHPTRSGPAASAGARRAAAAATASAATALDAIPGTLSKRGSESFSSEDRRRPSKVLRSEPSSGDGDLMDLDYIEDKPQRPLSGAAAASVARKKAAQEAAAQAAAAEAAAHARALETGSARAGAAAGGGVHGTPAKRGGSVRGRGRSTASGVCLWLCVYVFVCAFHVRA